MPHDKSLTGYQLFVRQYRIDHPTIPGREIIPGAAAEWRQLSDAQKTAKSVEAAGYARGAPRRKRELTTFGRKRNLLVRKEKKAHPELTLRQRNALIKERLALEYAPRDINGNPILPKARKVSERGAAYKEYRAGWIAKNKARYTKVGKGNKIVTDIAALNRALANSWRERPANYYPDVVRNPRYKHPRFQNDDPESKFYGRNYYLRDGKRIYDKAT